MRPIRTATLLTAGLVTLLGIPAAAAAEDPNILYVNNASSKCSDAGTGAPTAPYCTVSAAAKAVMPGQTVRIRPGKAYDEAVTIDRSGTPGKPITFASYGWPNGGTQAELPFGKGVTVRGASHVVIGGLRVGGGVLISGSTDVELDGIASSRGALDSLVVDGASKNVSIRRSELRGARIEGGSTGTVLGRNVVSGTHRSAVTVVDAPGTVVTNNTVYGSCAAALTVAGGSTDAGLFNNVLHTEARSDSCTSGDPRNGILVAQSAATGTASDHNLITGLPGARRRCRTAGPEPRTRTRRPSGPRRARAGTTS
ncbi:right-handed parallel beta-helix repeat-containing protein [Streptomyces sp. MS1.HAVA.3]|uniref:Right-handed parallel beta-helix repeat-containing protein n=1 Tax=Streptomyces caledonius TaxID=3134107 RepID=A0ABU8U680_9ACTN